MAAPDLGAVVRGVTAARRVLASTPLSDALAEPRRDLVVLYDTQSVGDALSTLGAWNLLSAPVVAGGPPWLRRGESPRTASHVTQHGAGNPRMAAVRGFLSVHAIMRAFVAETSDIRADSAEEVAAAANELWSAQIMEAFDEDALALDWEVLGATARDESGTWGVRGVPSAASRSLLDAITLGFLAPPRAARFVRADAGGDIAARAGAPGGAGAHRIAVWTHDEESGGEAVLVNVFSQSDAVRFLHASLADVAAGGKGEGEAAAAADVAALLACPLSSLGLGGTAETSDGGAVVARPVATTPAEAPVLAALRRMSDAGVSALGVVDADGALVANFSASDIRSLTPSHLSALSLPVAAFLEGLGRLSYYTYSGLAAKDLNRDELVRKYRAHAHFRLLAGRRPAPQRRLAAADDTVEGWAGAGLHPVGVLSRAERRGSLAAISPDAPLSEALGRLVRLGLHRLYTVDDVAGGAPVGVVTLTDILRLLASDVTLDWLGGRADPGAGKAGDFHWRRAAREAGRAGGAPPPPREPQA